MLAFLATYMYCYFPEQMDIDAVVILDPCINPLVPNDLQRRPQWKYVWKTNKYTNYSFSLLIMYGSFYMFWHYIAILREVPSAFWEMLNCGAVSRTLWMGGLCPVT
jgi:hypothetical protein